MQYASFILCFAGGLFLFWGYIWQEVSLMFFSAERQKRQEGALCDLLASLGLQNREEFDSFFASITADGE